MTSLCSDKSDVLISCGGGELMCEVLDYVDFDRIRKAEPKWYMGYSDNTNLVFLLTTLCDTAAVYGPCAGSFSMEPWHESIQDALDLLRGKEACHEGVRYMGEGAFKIRRESAGSVSSDGKTYPVLLPGRRQYLFRKTDRRMYGLPCKSSGNLL